MIILEDFGKLYTYFLVITVWLFCAGVIDIMLGFSDGSKYIGGALGSLIVLAFLVVFDIVKEME